MKRTWLLFFSSFIALSIAIYSKRSPDLLSGNSKPTWKTFVKTPGMEISGYKTTQKELEAARVPLPKREIAQENNNDQSKNQNAKLKLPMREGRVLIGDIQKNNYQDQDVELEMLNSINPSWKDVLGHELLRFQDEDTKVLIKEEFPIIQIRSGKGFYADQVIVTYVLKDGTINSYRALIDSETGSIVETWDRTIHEKFKKEGAGLSLPTENNSGIIAR